MAGVVSMAELFELQDVTFAHNATTEPVLKDFNLKIERGKRTAILGANGAGKTTLFYTLTGVNKPQSGQVLYDGEPLEYKRESLQKLRSDVAIVLQNPDEQIFCSLVDEDVAFGPMNIDMDQDEVEYRVAKALRDVRMTEFAKRPLQQLSGGQRKRVAIAGALAMNPKIMIMDEPTAGLDPQASMEVMELAEKLNLQGVTVLISTHEIDIAYKWAEVSNVLNHGKIEFSGDADDFYSNTESVYECGLLVPSAFSMNQEICSIEGRDPRPYPHNSCEFIAKTSPLKNVGRILCVPMEDGETERYELAIKEFSGASVGVYGSDSRYTLREKGVDYLYDAMDSCFMDALNGRDTILFHDSIYRDSIENQSKRLESFGTKIDVEVMQ